MTSEATVAPLHVFVARVGARMCAIDLRHVVEALRPLPIQALPGTPAFVCGVVTLRGEPVPVIDARILLGDPLVAPPQRLVALRTSRGCVALAVDSVMGVRTLEPTALRDLPRLFQNAPAVEALARLDHELLVLLQTASLVPDATWEVLEARRAPR